MFLLFIHCHYVLFYRTQQLYLTRNQYLCACSRGVKFVDPHTSGMQCVQWGQFWVVLDFIFDVDHKYWRKCWTSCFSIFTARNLALGARKLAAKELNNF